MRAESVRARFLFREVAEKGHDLPLGSVTKDGGVEFRSDLNVSVWNPGDDVSGYKRVRKDDFVIGLRSFQSGIGLSAIEALVSPAYTVLRPISKQVHPPFFRYLFKSSAYISRLENVAQGIRQGRTISSEDFYNIEVQVPPLAEQKAIADYLDRETTRIDALIEKKQSMISLLEKRFESSVFACVTYGLDSTVAMREVHQQWVGQIPEHWGMPTVSMNFDLQLGKMLNAESAEGPDQYPYLRNANVQWDRFDFDDLASMHFNSYDRQRCELKVGDVLVCEGGEVGRSAVWTGDLANCYFQKAIHRVRPRSNANGRFLMYCLRAAAKQSVFSVEGNTSTIVHLTREQLAVHRFPWPPFDEQAAIVEVLDVQTERLENARSVLRRQVATLSERRQTLITAMVTGELEIAEVAA